MPRRATYLCAHSMALQKARSRLTLNHRSRNHKHGGMRSAGWTAMSTSVGLGVGRILTRQGGETQVDVVGFTRTNSLQAAMLAVGFVYT